MNDLVESIMSRRVVGVAPDDALESAREMMRSGSVHHAPVLADHTLVGMLSDRDLLRARPRGKGLLVSQAMSTPPAFAAPNERLREVAARMVAGRFGCLPVVDGGEVLGIVTEGDLLARELLSSPTTPVALMMTGNPLVARPFQLLGTVADAMEKRRVRHAPVVEGETLVGILSERDVLGAPRDLVVRDAMTADPLTIDPACSMSEAIERMLSARIGALPVVEGGRLVGIVTRLDLLAHF